MLLDLLAALAGGLGMVVVAYLVLRVLRRRPGRWVYPASAGLGMLLMTVYLEQSWAGRIASQLPDGFVVAETRERTAWWQPWTLLSPRVDGMTVFDPAAARRNEASPELRLVELSHLDRASPTLRTYVFVDCASARQAAVGDDASFTREGLPAGVEWRPAEAALTTALCKGQAL